MTRAIKVFAALAMAGASVLGATWQASADPNPNNTGSNPQWITLNTADNVGVYVSPNANSNKFDNITLAPGGMVYADCWVAGGNVGNAGDVWYRTWTVWRGPTGAKGIGVGTSWTFAPYVDHAAAFHNVPGLPHC